MGSTAIGIKTKEGVVIAVEKRITSPLLVCLLYTFWWHLRFIQGSVLAQGLSLCPSFDLVELWLEAFFGFIVSLQLRAWLSVTSCLQEI